MSVPWEIMKAAFGTTEGKMLATAMGGGAVVGLGARSAIRQEQARQGREPGFLTGLGGAANGVVSAAALGGTLGGRFGWAGVAGGIALGGASTIGAAMIPGRVGNDSRGAAFTANVLQGSILSASTSLGAVMLSRGSLARTTFVQTMAKVDAKLGTEMLEGARRRWNGGHIIKETSEQMAETGLGGRLYNAMYGLNDVDPVRMDVLGPIGNWRSAKPPAGASLGARAKYWGGYLVQGMMGAPDLEDAILAAGSLTGISGRTMASAYAKDTLAGLPAGLALGGLSAAVWTPPEQRKNPQRAAHYRERIKNYRPTDPSYPSRYGQG